MSPRKGSAAPCTTAFRLCTKIDRSSVSDCDVPGLAQRTRFCQQLQPRLPGFRAALEAGRQHGFGDAAQGAGGYHVGVARSGARERAADCIVVDLHPEDLG